MSQLPRAVICASLPAALALALVGCGQAPSHDTSSPSTPVVKVTSPIERDVPDYVFFTGRTSAVESLEVRARVTGYLVDINFKPGEEIKKYVEPEKGQKPKTDEKGKIIGLLFVIDPRPYQATLAAAKAQIKLNEATKELAIADNARAKEIAKTPGAISKQDLDKYAAAEVQSTAALEASRANAESAELDFKFTHVTSPIDGIVGRNLLTIGNLVVKDSTLLTTIVSQDPMWAYFDVDERTMLRVQKRIREGKFKSSRDGAVVPVELGLATEGQDYPHKGTIDFVNNQVDTSTGTIQVRGTFPNPKLEHDQRLLTPGLFVRIRVRIGEFDKALLVPQIAIGTDQGVKYLLVVNDKNVVEYRPIEVGPQQPGGLQVVLPVKVVRTEEGVRAAREGEEGVDSLTKDEQVVVTGLQRVRAGATVEPRPYGKE